MKLKILAVVALAAVGLGAAFVALGGVPSTAAGATKYLTGTATTGNVTDDVAATGALAAQASYGLVFGNDPYLVTDTSTAPASTTTWPVSKVDAVVGATVSKGDVLAVADTADLKADLAKAERAVKSAEVSLRAAKTSLSDAEDADVTAQIRQAKTGLYSAETQLADAKKDRQTIKDQIAGATIKAPVDGVIVEVNVTPGFDAPSGAAVVLDSKAFEVTTDVVESDLADIKIGQPATVAISAIDATVDGTVTAIAAVGSGDSGSGVVSYPVTVALTNPPATARSGMTADVTITVANAANVLTVPASALQGTAGDYRVLILGADGVPQAQTVDVGLVTSSAAEIKSGLTEGQAVVTGVDTPLTGATTTSGGFGGGGLGGGFGGGPVIRVNGGGNRSSNGN